MTVNPHRPLALAAIAATACGTTATVPTAAAHSPAPTSTEPHPVPAATHSTATRSAACAAIGKTLAGITADANARARTRHAQLPSVSEKDLADAYAAGDLNNSGQALYADEETAGITPGLKTAEENLLTAGMNLYATYGQTAPDAKYSSEVQAALAAISRECP
jgi:hypothetical protein